MTHFSWLTGRYSSRLKERQIERVLKAASCVIGASPNFEPMNKRTSWAHNGLYDVEKLDFVGSFIFVYLFISRSQVVAFEKVQSSHEGRLRHCWDSTLTNVNSQFEDKKKRSALGEGNIRREEFVMALHYLGVYGCCMYCIIAGVGHNPRTSKMLAFQETIKTASLFINIASSKGASHCQLSKLIK